MRPKHPHGIGFFTEGEGFIIEKTAITKHLAKLPLLFLARVDPELVDDKKSLFMFGRRKMKQVKLVGI
jgi:hypothetical protein